MNDIPKIGQKWRLKNNDGSPWSKSKSKLPPAFILDVKDGWVRYKIGSGNYWNDERDKIDLFQKVYELVDN